MYYRENSPNHISKWRRITTKEFYARNMHKNSYIEFKDESPSPKQVAQRKKFILKGQILSAATQLSNLIYIKSTREALKMAEWEKLKLFEVLTILSETAKRIK